MGGGEGKGRHQQGWTRTGSGHSQGCVLGVGGEKKRRGTKGPKKKKKKKKIVTTQNRGVLNYPAREASGGRQVETESCGREESGPRRKQGDRV